MALDRVTKQAIIWALIIIFGGGLVSLALGHGFWGEKAPAAQGQQVPWPDNWGSSGPNQGEKCVGNKCNDCHKGY